MSKKRTVRRFTRLQIVEHILLLTSFVLLAITGLPQKYPEASASIWTIVVFGGIDVLRIVHRVSAIVLIALTFVHGLELLVRARRYGWRGGLMPGIKDVQDLWHQVLYYLGRVSQPPKYDKFTFREKFEYFGVVWGTVIMAATGVLLWVPEFFTQIVPGWLISASRAAHGGEALLAVLTIVIWHFYNVIFRRDIFPLDTTIFTGKISVERLKEEHPLEYERLIKTGALEDGHDAGEAGRKAAGASGEGRVSS